MVAQVWVTQQASVDLITLQAINTAAFDIILHP